jgi:hypothetical protein
MRLGAGHFGNRRNAPVGVTLWAAVLKEVASISDTDWRRVFSQREFDRWLLFRCISKSVERSALFSKVKSFPPGILLEIARFLRAN